MKQLTKTRDSFLMVIDYLRALLVEQGKYVSQGIPIPEDRGLSVSDIFYEININFATLTGIGKSLSKNGLVEIKEGSYPKQRRVRCYLTKEGYDTVTSFNKWEMDHNMKMTSIYTLSENSDGSIRLYRDRDNIRTKKL